MLTTKNQTGSRQFYLIRNLFLDARRNQNVRFQITSIENTYFYCSIAEKFYFLEFPPSLYLGKCEADGGLKIYVMATVQENGQRFASYETVEFHKPDIKIEVPSFFVQICT